MASGHVSRVLEGAELRQKGRGQKTFIITKRVSLSTLSPKKIKAFDRLFFLSGERSACREHFSIWVCLLGNEEEAKKFKVKIKLLGGLAATTDVYPMTLDSATIQAQKFPFLCPANSVLPLANEKMLISLEIKIINMKAEANKNEDAESGVSDNE